MTGNWNTSDRNTGDCNTGNWNTGDWNTGNWNTGHCNMGDRNAGDRNTGDCNTGNWNAGDRNTGYFNTDTPSMVRVFNKDVAREKWNECDKPDFIYFELTYFIVSENMTDKEKEDNPSYGDVGGYLKKKAYKEAFKESYGNATEEDRKKIFNIPNFDADLFLEISGIDVRVDSVVADKKKALVEKANELLKQAEDL